MKIATTLTSKMDLWPELKTLNEIMMTRFLHESASKLHRPFVNNLRMLKLLKMAVMVVVMVISTTKLMLFITIMILV